MKNPPRLGKAFTLSSLYRECTLNENHHHHTLYACLCWNTSCHVPPRVCVFERVCTQMLLRIWNNSYDNSTAEQRAVLFTALSSINNTQVLCSNPNELGCNSFLYYILRPSRFGRLKDGFYIRQHAKEQHQTSFLITMTGKKKKNKNQTTRQV